MKRMKEERRKTVDLGKEGTRMLVQCVQANPCLWNAADPYYKNKKMYTQSWDAISARFGVPVEELQHKWASVHSSYRHFWIKYHSDGTKNPDIPETESPKRRWYLYDDMLFLSGYKKAEAVDEQLPPVRIVMEDDPSDATVLECNDPLDINLEEIEPTESSSSTKLNSTLSEGLVGEMIQPSLYTAKKVFKTKLTYEKDRLSRPSNVSTVTSKIVRVGNSSNDALRYGQNIGKVLAQWSPRRRQAAMIKIDELMLQMEKARYREHYGADP